MNLFIIYVSVMLALSPTIRLSPALLSSLARVLSSERSFVARIADMFVLLHQAVHFHDGRLICWLNGGSADLSEQFTTAESWAYPWNDDLTWQALRQKTPLRLSQTPGMRDLPETITIAS